VTPESAGRRTDGAFRTRPPRHAAFLVISILLTASAINGYASYRTGSLLEPVSLAVDAAPESGIHALYVGWGGHVEMLGPVGSELRWSFERRQISSLRLYIPLSSIERLGDVAIDIGTRRFRYTADEVRRQWSDVDAESEREVSPVGSEDRPSPAIILEAPATVRGADSRMGSLARLLNWPGDAHAAVRILVWPSALTVLLTVAVFLVCRGAGRPELNDTLGRLIGWTALDATVSRRSDLVWGSTGGAVLLGALSILEVSQPLYFTQSDNFAQFLPVILQGVRSLQEGVFPTWNPYQLLGAPTASVGVYALTYPPTYAAYLMAVHLFQNEYLTLEVFVVGHLLVGYVVTLALGRRLGLRPPLAALVSLSFLLSGYSLIAGRSWYYHVPLVVWAPALVWAAVRLERKPGDWKWAIGTGFLIGAFFHAGNAQMWAYGLLLIGVAVSLQLLGATLPWRRALWWIPAMFMGLAVAAPLLVPQRMETAGIARVGGASAGIADGLLAMLLPFPIARAAHPRDWGSSNVELMGQYYYSGTLLTASALVVALLLVAWLIVYQLDTSRFRELVGRNVWLICGAVALLFALGDHGVVWIVLARLPLFNQFDFAFKFLPYVNLFVLLSGGITLERHLRSKPKAKLGARGMFATGCVLLLYHVTLARPSHYTYGDYPYPPLPASLTQLLGTERERARLLTFAPTHYPDRGYVASLAHNFASIYHIPAFHGFDPLVQARPEDRAVAARMAEDPVAAARAYGVRWIIAHRAMETPEYGANPAQSTVEAPSPFDRRVLQVLTAHAVNKVTLEDIAVWDLGENAALAFAADDPGKALPVHFTGNGATVDVASLEGRNEPITVNVLARPQLSAWAGGRRLASTRDEWNRLRIHVPPGSDVVVVRYSPEWHEGLVAAIMLGLLAATAAIWLQRRRVTSGF
jgi:hypothetical protein